MVEKPTESVSRSSDYTAGANQYTDQTPTSPEERLALESIYKILYQVSGVDFSNYRQSTVMRRLSRRMGLSKQDSIEDYLVYMTDNSKEIELLYDDLLLFFTEFFRDQHIFGTLKKKVFPKLVENRSVKSPIRIWVPGCSTGEEVYSLAICLYEFLEVNKANATVQLFGTDLVERHIVKARAAVYPEKIKKTVSPERLERFFDQTPEGLKVTKYIREMCVFATQDVTRDPPFPNIDLVSCRNLLIYFSDVFQETAIPLFHFALRPSGFLMLGSSETMGKFPELFSNVDQKANVYAKRNSGTKPMYRFPALPALSLTKAPYAKIKPGISGYHDEKNEFSKKIDDILMETYVPPGVLVDNNMQIREFRGKTSPFLSPIQGEASLKLSKMAEEGLIPDLYVAIEEAKKKQEKVKKKNITFTKDGDLKTVDISVIPVLEPTGIETCFLILFEDSITLMPPEKSVGLETDTIEQRRDDELISLRRELQSTKEHLQSIIEEKDEVNQELWSANEEVQSTNEELQSVNEEMEAAKEELESGNEELIALNEELHTKNIEIGVAQQRFEKLFKHSPSPAGLSVLPGRKFVDVNDAFVSMIGYSKQELIGKTSDDLNLFVSQKQQLEIVEQLAEKGSVSNVEIQIYRKDGTILDGIFKGELVEIQETPHLLATIVDITERKRLESDLRQAYKLESLGTLTGGIAHDFNNILSIILGNTELALDDTPVWNSTYTNLEEVKKACVRAAGIIKQLLSFNRKTDNELRPVDLTTVVRSTLNLLRSSIPTTIDIRKKIPHTVQMILADPGQVNQVIMNLCINALQAMEETGGLIEVIVEPEFLTKAITIGNTELPVGEYVKVIIKDTGPGIKPAVIDRIFDPYFTTRSKEQSSGMGLATVHGIVKNHGGAICIESTVGRGAKFSVFLPLSQVVNGIETEIQKEIPHGTETILFVDDETSIVNMAGEMLKRLGYNVESRTSPVVALELFQSKPDYFDVVITDMTMPQMTGAKFAEELMEIRKNIPIIICSGHSTLMDEEKAKALGVSAYILKPVVKSVIARTIRTVLEK